MKAPRVIFAVGKEEERLAFAALWAGGPAESGAGGGAGSGAEGGAGGSAFGGAADFGAAYFPKDISDVEALVSSDSADVIITDFSFHSGAFADWLMLWPLPAILLVDAGDPQDKIERTVADEASLFVQRDPRGDYVSRLPMYVRKVLNVKESLKRQNAHLKMTEHQYMNLLQAVPDIVYTLDGEGRFLYLNDSIRKFGFEPQKLIGRHFSEIIHPADVSKVSRTAVLGSFRGIETGMDAAPKLFDERRSGPRMTRNLELRLRVNIRSEDFLYASVNAYGEVSAGGWQLPEYENVELGTVGIIRDITTRKEHEIELEKALAAKEVLLKEIHHRVKNNLQVVSSLLNLQENVVHDPSAQKVFLECQTQIQSMAMVHEVLYRTDNFEGVEMQVYFERLAEYLWSVYEGMASGIHCRVEAGGAFLDLDSAIPVALVVNELVSNSFKHGFPDGRTGTITISMRESTASWELVVEDDGVGFDHGESVSRNAKSEPGIGTELINALSSQLRGDLERSSRGGARVRIRFPKS